MSTALSTNTLNKGMLDFINSSSIVWVVVEQNFNTIGALINQALNTPLT